MPPLQIFISYAREDQDWAIRLYKDLQREGYKPWLDTEALLPGARWKDAIQDAIRDSHGFIAVLSANSVSGRGYVQRELKEALEVLAEFPRDQIFVIPARIDDCRPVDPTLRELNWLDLFPVYEQGFQRLLLALEAIAGREFKAPAPEAASAGRAAREGAPAGIPPATVARPGMPEAFRTALGNVTRHGDTDVFPFPIENHLFFDRTEETVELLQGLHRQDAQDFRRSLGGFLHEEALAVAGYNGFRWATQIDPLWNAYLLGLVIAIGDDIERARIPAAKKVVFSYRFKPDLEEKTLFDREIGWAQFQHASLNLAERYGFVLICDIADFYLRIDHQRLENALRRSRADATVATRILELLRALSKGASSGLPVGGPAARLLSELLLNDTDRLLAAQVPFHRYVDDYHVFARSEKEARSHLAVLSELLLTNDGLPLQKSKTRILSAEEFRSLYDPESAEDQTEALARNVLSLRLHFDPYSPTRVQDYEALQQEMGRFPIEEMLASQMRKSRIDQAVTRKLIQMVRFQEATVRDHAVASLLDSLTVLYPVFPTVMILVKGVLPELSEETRQRAFAVLRGLIADGSHLVRVPANLAFAVRVLAHDSSEETVQVLDGLYRRTHSMMLQRDILLGMARNDCQYWISAQCKEFDRMGPWERRALIVASYILEEEGRLWREAVRDRLQPIERLTLGWAAERYARGRWDIPL